MIRSRTAALFAALAVAAVSLAGCAGGSSAGTPTATVTVTVTPTPSPTPTPTPTESAKIAVFPTDCGAVGTAATRQATVDAMTMQDDGTGFVRPAPDGATLKLGCDWIEGDATGILLLISEATPAAVSAAVAALPAQGYTCSTARAGNPLCTMTVAGSPADAVETIYARDNVWIFMSAVNIDGGQLLSDLAVQMWP
jgi:hypothetical protein